MATETAPLPDYVSRVKRPSPLGTALFVCLRTADLILQYSLIVHHSASGALSKVGIPTTPAPTAGPFHLPTAADLSALPLQARLLLALALGSAVKQIYWATLVSENEMPVGMAVAVGLFNCAFNSFNSVASTLSPVIASFAPSLAGSLPGKLGFVAPRKYDPDALSPLFLLGCAVGFAGQAVEGLSEVQRRNFKAEDRNRGKPFTGGLFGVARHVNYGAYTIWRTGYALAAGGPIWGAFVFWFFFQDFVTRGVPVLDRYCSARYGQQWQNYKKNVRWALIPGVY